MFFTILSTAEIALGRSGYASMPQHMLLELFLPKIDYDRVNLGDFENVCEWNNVQCNDKEEVVDIEWAHMFNHPECIEWRWIPNSVSHLVLCGNNFQGTIDLSLLPRNMEHLNLYYNSFSGSVDFPDLPSSMRYVEFCDNLLAGTVELRDLPLHLQELWLSGNKFSGSLDLMKLPQTMKTLALDENKFSGTINLLHLPKTLEELSFCQNNLSGTLILPKMCETTIQYEPNKFEGIFLQQACTV